MGPPPPLFSGNQPIRRKVPNPSPTADFLGGLGLQVSDMEATFYYGPIL